LTNNKGFIKYMWQILQMKSSTKFEGQRGFHPSFEFLSKSLKP